MEEEVGWAVDAEDDNRSKKRVGGDQPAANVKSKLRKAQ